MVSAAGLEGISCEAFLLFASDSDSDRTLTLAALVLGTDFSSLTILWRGTAEVLSFGLWLTLHLVHQHEVFSYVVALH
jgi:hypothetical protein